VSGILAPAVFAMHLAACAQQHPVVLQAPVQRHLAHATAESGMRALAIHDNTTGQSAFPETAAEAVALAGRLLAAGHRIDAGVMQVTDRNWPSYGLTVETAFDPAANVCAGARILGEAFQIERRAACRYNSGRPDCGNQYPDLVQRAELRIMQQPAVSVPAIPVVPPKPSCAPSWDLMALATCQQHKPGPSK
jgi:type IV secretion system protein VirB1